MNIRTDAKSISLLAVFSSIIMALEVFPIPGVTDLYTPAPSFTIDWTGIPIVIIFFGLGTIYSFFSIVVMFIAIVYRNFQGAFFKGAAESITLLGLIIAKLIIKDKKINRRSSIVVYIIFGALFSNIINKEDGTEHIKSL